MWTKFTFSLEYGLSNLLLGSGLWLVLYKSKMECQRMLKTETRKFPLKMPQIPCENGTFYVSCSIHSTSSIMHEIMTSFLFRPHLSLSLGKLKSNCTRIRQFIHENLLEQFTIVAKEWIPIVQCWVGAHKIMDKLAQQTHFSLPVIEDTWEDHWANYQIYNKECKDHNKDSRYFKQCIPLRSTCG